MLENNATKPEATKKQIEEKSNDEECFKTPDREVEPKAFLRPRAFNSSKTILNDVDPKIKKAVTNT